MNVPKMTRGEDGKLAAAAVSDRNGIIDSTVQPQGGFEWERTMRSILALTLPVIALTSIGIAEAADPMLLAETGGYLLGNAHRCGVPIERVQGAERVIHDFIVSTAKDASEVAVADSRFAAIFVASARPDPDPDAFPSCTVVIQQFERLEKHHEQARMARGIRAADPEF